MMETKETEMGKKFLYKVMYSCNNDCTAFEGGFTCVGGSPTSRTICTEDCKDGNDAGWFDCDNGLGSPNTM